MPFDGSSNPTAVDAVTQRLIEGRVRIEKGWCQGTFHRADDSFCMVAAIMPHPYIFDTQEPIFLSAAQRLRDAVGPTPELTQKWTFPENLNWMCEWNNNRWRSKEQVLDVFDKAIAAAA